MEEAGAKLLGELELFEAHVAVSRNTQPHLAHWPHPRAPWAYALCRAQVVAASTAPENGEVITGRNLLWLKDIPATVPPRVVESAVTA